MSYSEDNKRSERHKYNNNLLHTNGSKYGGKYGVNGGIYGGVQPVGYKVSNVRDANRWDKEENLLFSKENETRRMVRERDRQRLTDIEGEIDRYRETYRNR